MKKGMSRHAPAFDVVAQWYDSRIPQRYLKRLHWRALDIAAPFLEKRTMVLEVGCGTGNFLRLLSERFPGLWLCGVDESHEMIKRAKRKGIPAELVLGASEKLNYRDASFDAVFMVEALHHFRGPRAALTEARRVLQPGGFLLVLDPFSDGVLRRACFRVVRKLISIEKDAHVFSSAEFDLALVERGFSVVADRRYWFQRVVLALKESNA